MPEFTHKVKSLDEILALTAQANKQVNQASVPSYLFSKPKNSLSDQTGGIQVHNLPIDRLIPYKSHPFKLYDGKRYDDMIDSIKANGVLSPIIVRPIDSSTYEVLSGHNRVNAAKVAGLDSIPAIVRDGLGEDEALLIVTETNLIQRSFADLSHSERALTITKHYDVIKKLWRRNTLVCDIENMLKAQNTEVSEVNVPMASQKKSLTKTADYYGLDSSTAARYLRISKLIKPLKDMMDDGELAVRSGVALSYLSEKEQEIVEGAVANGNYKIDMKKAEALRLASRKGILTAGYVEELLSGKRKVKEPSSNSFKLHGKLVAKYFTKGEKKADIEKIIVQALEYYFACKTELLPVDESDPNEFNSQKNA